MKVPIMWKPDSFLFHYNYSMSNSDSINKVKLRQENKRLRSSLTPNFCHHASLAICKLIQEWRLFKTSKTVLTYMSMGSEVDLSPLFLQNIDKEWVIPRIKKGGEMVFHVYEPEKLVRHRYGMLEPDKVCASIPVDKIQLTLVPGLAFDLQGWRLGYGGGFYDRFLAHYQGISAGITFHELIQTQIPRAAHDIAVQYVISENGIFPT